MTWSSLVQAPTEVLHITAGIPNSTWARCKQLSLVIAPGTGGNECNEHRRRLNLCTEVGRPQHPSCTVHVCLS